MTSQLHANFENEQQKVVQRGGGRGSGQQRERARQKASCSRDWGREDHYPAEGQSEIEKL